MCSCNLGTFGKAIFYFGFLLTTRGAIGGVRHNTKLKLVRGMAFSLIRFKNCDLWKLIVCVHLTIVVIQ